jgi:hypothetical protein
MPDARDQEGGAGQPAGGRAAGRGHELVAGHRPEAAGVRQVRRAGLFDGFEQALGNGGVTHTKTPGGRVGTF